jgi:hypothetical protein
MQATGNNAAQQPRIVIRIGSDSLSFSVVDLSLEHKLCYEPFDIRNGISMAANLRDAFKENNLLRRDFKRAKVLLDSPVLLVPVEDFDPESKEVLYHHVYSSDGNDEILHHIINELNVVALFAVNKDLKMVLTDHFTDLRILPLMQPVWRYMHKRSFNSVRRKLYGYFHDGKIDVFSYNHNRFQFANSFDASHAADTAYYLLNVWQQMGLTDRDELFLVGEASGKDELLEILRKYIANVYFLRAASEFNRAPMTKIEGLPFDLLTIFIRG